MYQDMDETCDDLPLLHAVTKAKWGGVWVGVAAVIWWSALLLDSEKMGEGLLI